MSDFYQEESEKYKLIREGIKRERWRISEIIDDNLRQIRKPKNKIITEIDLARQNSMIIILEGLKQEINKDTISTNRVIDSPQLVTHDKTHKVLAEEKGDIHSQNKELLDKDYSK